MAAGGVINVRIGRVEPGVAYVKNVGVGEEDRDVGVGGIVVVQLPRAAVATSRVCLSVKVRLGRASAGRAGKSPLTSDIVCATPSRRSVFSCARIVAPAERIHGLPSVWS